MGKKAINRSIEVGNTRLEPILESNNANDQDSTVIYQHELRQSIQPAKDENKMTLPAAINQHHSEEKPPSKHYIKQAAAPYNGRKSPVVLGGNQTLNNVRFATIDQPRNQIVPMVVQPANQAVI